MKLLRDLVAQSGGNVVLEVNHAQPVGKYRGEWLRKLRIKVPYFDGVHAVAVTAAGHVFKGTCTEVMQKRIYPGDKVRFYFGPSLDGGSYPLMAQLVK